MDTVKEILKVLAAYFLAKGLAELVVALVLMVRERSGHAVQ